MTGITEFILWANCTNNCKFCWQRKLNNPLTNLTDEQKLDSIARCSEKIDTLDYTDILIVGGEVYCPHTDAINEALSNLFGKIATRIREGKTRYMYVNTNLNYENKVNLISLFNAFDGIEGMLKFTTSIDVHGRETINGTMVYDNLDYIRENYPRINVCVNTILTKQLCEMYGSKGRQFNIKQVMDRFGAKYVNLIPLIPIPDDDSMTPTWGQVIATLEKADKDSDGYLKHYVGDYDLNQDKTLYEYHSDVGYTECTAEHMACGHNTNFSKATPDGSCYICELKKYMKER